jgi:hypothetical protein
MPIPKSLAEWLALVPDEDTRRRIAHNYAHARRTTGDYINADGTYDRFCNLIWAFDWDKTPEGFDFWYDYQDRVEKWDIGPTGGQSYAEWLALAEQYEPHYAYVRWKWSGTGMFRPAIMGICRLSRKPDRYRRYVGRIHKERTARSGFPDQIIATGGYWMLVPLAYVYDLCQNCQIWRMEYLCQTDGDITPQAWRKSINARLKAFYLKQGTGGILPAPHSGPWPAKIYKSKSAFVVPPVPRVPFEVTFVDGHPLMAYLNPSSADTALSGISATYRT